LNHYSKSNSNLIQILFKSVQRISSRYDRVVIVIVYICGMRRKVDNIIQDKENRSIMNDLSKDGLVVKYSEYV